MHRLNKIISDIFSSPIIELKVNSKRVNYSDLYVQVPLYQSTEKKEEEEEG